MSNPVSTPTMRKIVLVLGRSASGLPLPASTEIPEGVVVLALGWPLTDPQRAILEEAEARARTAHVRFDAHLLASPRQIRALVEATDRILIDAKPREARRIRRALDRR